MIPPVSQFIRFDDKLLQILRYYPNERVRNVDAIKTWLGSDIAIKKENTIYFCSTIQEAEEVAEDMPVIKKRGRPKKTD